MDRRPSILERAFDLARTGNCRSVGEVRERLTREGYEFAYSHTSGSLVMRQLKAEFAKHRSLKEGSSTAVSEAAAKD